MIKYTLTRFAEGMFQVATQKLTKVDLIKALNPLS
jgi:hypothetical protein